MEAADLDLDGDVDLMLEGRICLNNGAGVFAQSGTVALGSGQVLALFDLDGDGSSDLVSPGGTPTSPIGRWYRNLGAATFAPAVNLPAALVSPIVHADFDRDGDEDLVAQGPSILTNLTRQLSRRTIPRPGRPASLDLAGPPGAGWLLFASSGTGSLPLPPLGTVFLDLATTQFFSSGVFSPAGTSTVTAITPNVLGIVGVSVFWQAVVYEPLGPRLTGLERITVASF